MIPLSFLGPSAILFARYGFIAARSSHRTREAAAQLAVALTTVGTLLSKFKGTSAKLIVATDSIVNRIGPITADLGRRHVEGCESTCPANTVRAVVALILVALEFSRTNLVHANACAAKLWIDFILTAIVPCALLANLLDSNAREEDKLRVSSWEMANGSGQGYQFERYSTYQ
jgi:hypothetical protein